MKKFYTSKTLWVNTVAIIALFVQTKTGFIVPPELQAGALSLINMALRLITKEPIEWNRSEHTSTSGDN